MNQEYLERFEKAEHTVSIGGEALSTVALKAEYEDEMLDLIFEHGEESGLLGLSLDEQIALCRFYDGALPNSLYHRRYLFPKVETRYEDVKGAFLSGYEISLRPHGARLWCALTTHSGLFLGFLVDGNHMLYVGETIGITDMDTSGDNNGAGYKGGDEDSGFSLSLVMDPDVKGRATSGTYLPDEAARSASSVTLPEGITEIAPRAFRGFTALTEVILPEGLVKIGRRAFEGCTSLTRVVFPSTLRSLNGHAFSGCSALAELILPEGVTVIPRNAFEGCAALKKATLPGVTHLETDAFLGCEALTAISFPRLTHLGSFALSDCTSLKKLDLPEGLISLGFCCFRSCQSLTAVTIPSTVTEIDDNIFFYCDALKKVTVPASMADAFREAMECAMTTKHADLLDKIRIIEV